MSDTTGTTLNWLRQPFGFQLRQEFQWDDTGFIDRPTFCAAGSSISGGTYEASRLATVTVLA